MRPRSLLSRGRRAAGRVVIPVASNAIPSSLAAQSLMRRLTSKPTWTPPGTICLSYALSQRLRELSDEPESNRWLHHRWLSIYDEMWSDLRSANLLPPTHDFSYLCLGPGAINTYAFSLLVFLGGAADVTLVEPEPPSSDAACREFWGLQEIVLRLLTGAIDAPARGFDVSRIEEFVDLEALFFGAAGKDPLRRERVLMMRKALEDASLPSSSADLVSSRSVLEHVIHFDSFADTLARVVRPGGVVYHDIDLTAHSERGPFEFYYRAEPSSALNELRLGDHVDALEDRGFDVTVLRTHRADGSALERDRLATRFRHYDDDDLLTSRVVLAARRL